jgi:hypothetical protein
MWCPETGKIEKREGEVDLHIHGCPEGLWLEIWGSGSYSLSLKPQAFKNLLGALKAAHSYDTSKDSVSEIWFQISDNTRISFTLEPCDGEVYTNMGFYAKENAMVFSTRQRYLESLSEYLISESKKIYSEHIDFSARLMSERLKPLTREELIKPWA